MSDTAFVQSGNGRKQAENLTTHWGRTTWRPSHAHTHVYIFRQRRVASLPHNMFLFLGNAWEPRGNPHWHSENIFKESQDRQYQTSGFIRRPWSISATLSHPCDPVLPCCTCSRHWPSDCLISLSHASICFHACVLRLTIKTMAFCLFKEAPACTSENTVPSCLL